MTKITFQNDEINVEVTKRPATILLKKEEVKVKEELKEKKRSEYLERRSSWFKHWEMKGVNDGKGGYHKRFLGGGKRPKIFKTD